MQAAGHVFVFLIVAAVSGGVARGQAVYTLTDLGSYSGTNTGPRGIANGGAIVANLTVGGFQRGFLLTQGTSVGIGTLGGTTSEVRAIAVNGTSAAVQITGGATTVQGETHAFLWTQGGSDGVGSNPQMKDLGSLGGARSEGFAVNDRGHVAGYSEVITGYEHAFLHDGNSMVDVGAVIAGQLGLPWSYAYDVNSSRRVIGTAYDQNFTTSVAFSYDGTTTRNLGNLGVSWSEAWGINNANHVVGYSTLADGTEQAFLWSGVGMSSLGSLGGSSYAYAINNGGTVVGGAFADVAETDYRAFVTVSGTMLDLNGLLDASGQGWKLSEAIDINDAGQIIGLGRVAGGTRGFLLTPQADVLMWSGNGAQAGGSGTWNSSASTWLVGGTPVTWLSGASAVFSGDPGTVTVSGSVAVAGGIDVRADGFTITGGTITFTGTSAAARTITVQGGASTTLTTTLTGSSGVSKAGAGVLVLDGAGILSGTTTVSEGVLRVTRGDALGATDVVIDAGASLDIRPLVGGLVMGSGQTLGGAGTVVGSVTFGGGSTLSPGLSGALTTSGLVASAGEPVIPAMISVPEPTALGLVGIGLGCLGVMLLSEHLRHASRASGVPPPRNGR